MDETRVLWLPLKPARPGNTPMAMGSQGQPSAEIPCFELSLAIYFLG